jgi:hypothetical protein
MGFQTAAKTATKSYVLPLASAFIGVKGCAVSYVGVDRSVETIKGAWADFKAKREQVFLWVIFIR